MLSHTVISLEKDAQRPLGLGFGLGKAFTLFRRKEEKSRSLISSRTLGIKQGENLLQWIEKQQSQEAKHNDNDTSADITTILSKEDLSLHINDVLDNMSIIQLRKYLPRILSNLSEETKSLFSRKANLERLQKAWQLAWETDADLYEILRKQLLKGKDLPEMPSDRFIGPLNSFLEKSQSAFPKRVPYPFEAKFITEMESILDKDKLGTISPEAMALLIPEILFNMQESDRQQVAVEIAKQLSPKYFLPLAQENFFKFQALQNSSSDKVNAILDSNGRTIQLNAALANNTHKQTYQYLGKEWTLNHLHIHFEQKGEEGEFRLYDSREQLRAVKEGKQEDPNQNLAGEVHLVFERLSLKGNKRLMALGYILQVNKDKRNEDYPHIQELLEKLKQAESGKTQFTLDYKKVFMPNFEEAQANDALFLHNWASLVSSTHAFQAGIPFIIVPPEQKNEKYQVEMSQQQYDEFRKLFNKINADKMGVHKFAADSRLDPETKMLELKKEDELDPYTRRYGMYN